MFNLAVHKQDGCLGVTKTKNISDRAYIHIRETLLRSDVYVGQKILHQELGQKLEISHTPLREALFRLAAEGLLTHENYKGFSVPAITLDEAVDIYEIRELIEPYMAKKAAKVMTASLFAEFSEILEQYKQHISEPYSRRRILLDKKFHMKIADLSDNKTLSSALNLICDKLILKSPISRISPERGREAIEEHTQLLKSLGECDGKRAFTLMKSHINKQKRYMLEHIKLKDTEDLLEPLFA